MVHEYAYKTYEYIIKLANSECVSQMHIALLPQQLMCNHYPGFGRRPNLISKNFISSLHFIL